MAKKMNSEFAYDALYNTVGNIVYLVCLWGITILVVRLSGYEDAGILSVSMTTCNIFFVIANYGMRSFQASDITGQYGNQHYLQSRIITTVLGIFLCIAFSAICGYGKYQFIAIQIYMMFKSVEAVSDVLFGVMQRNHKLKNAGISLIVKGIGCMVFFSLGLLIWKELMWALVLMCAWSVLVMLLYDIPQTIRIDPSIAKLSMTNRTPALQLLKECFPMFLVSVAPMVLQAVPKLAFERIYSTAEFGIYSSVASPTVVLSTLVSCIMIPFLPLFASAIHKNDRKKLLKLFLIFSISVLALGALTCILSLLLGGWALTFLYGNDLYEYNTLLMWVFCSVTLTSLLYCLNALFISGRKLTILAVVYIAADVLCWIISWPLIRVRGIYGITDTLIISQLVQCIVLSALCIPLFFRPKRKA